MAESTNAPASCRIVARNTLLTVSPSNSGELRSYPTIDEQWGQGWRRFRLSPSMAKIGQPLANFDRSRSTVTKFWANMVNI